MDSYWTIYRAPWDYNPHTGETVQEAGTPEQAGMYADAATAYAAVYDYQRMGVHGTLVHVMSIGRKLVFQF